MKYIKQVLRFIKKNMLLMLMIFFCLLMWIYGYMLKNAGYMLTGESSKQPLIALAFNKLSDGVYPWNMKDNKLDDYGFVETIELEADAFSVLSENQAETSISEDAKNMSNDEPEYEGVYAYMNGSDYTIGNVPINYFDDAVFIGDSRMEGVYEFAGLSNATFLTRVSMSIYTLMESKVSNPDYKTVLEGLEDKQYGKVYIMVGINEIGTATTDYFVRHYIDVIKQIKELQPDAIIIVQAIMHVTPSRDETDEYFNNTNINERNEGLRALANGKDIFYLDVNPVYDDENGNLVEEYSSDNIHLYGNKYVEWRKFFLEHGIYKKGEDPFAYTVSDNSASENELSEDSISEDENTADNNKEESDDQELVDEELSEDEVLDE